MNRAITEMIEVDGEFVSEGSEGSEVAIVEDSVTGHGVPFVQLQGEPNHWFDMYCRYALIGPRRSLSRCYRQVLALEGKEMKKGLPGNFGEAATKWQWVARAAKWDRLNRAMDASVIAQQRVDLKLQLVEALQKHLLKLNEASESLNVDEAKWRDVSHGLRVVAQQLGKLIEMGDGNGVEEPDVLSTILAQLPGDVMVSIRTLMEVDVDTRKK